jgi:hypothetical protein
MKQTIKRHLNKRKYTRKLRKLRKKYTRNMRKATRNLLKKSRRFMKKTYKLQRGGDKTAKKKDKNRRKEERENMVAQQPSPQPSPIVLSDAERNRRERRRAFKARLAEGRNAQATPTAAAQAMPTAEEAGKFFDGLRTSSQAQVENISSGVPQAEAKVKEARCEVPFIIYDGEIKNEDKLKDRIEEIVNRDECYSEN